METPVEFIRKVPKAELHLHLEGTMTAEDLIRLSRKYGTEYRARSTEALAEELFEYRDFSDFLRTFRIVCEHLRAPEDYGRLFSAAAASLRRQNVRYAEILYSPSIPWHFERDGEAILQELLEQGRRVESEGDLQVRWILDSVRQWGPEPAQRTVELARRYRSQGVVGVGLGGDERSGEMEEFAEVFTWAKAHQLFVYVHAGEIGNPEEIWKAVRLLGANRIAHGIHAARDGALMEYLRDHAIALDVCLTSNFKTGAWVPLSENPFKLLFDRGVPVTLNTDDPGLFQTTLCEEYEKACKAFELSRDDLQRLILQAVRSAFLSHDRRLEMMQEFYQEFSVLEV